MHMDKRIKKIEYLFLNAILGNGKLNARCHPVMDYHPIHGEVEILLAASCYRNQDKLLPDWLLGSYM